jgi:hypothetical protein
MRSGYAPLCQIAKESPILFAVASGTRVYFTKMVSSKEIQTSIATFQILLHSRYKLPLRERKCM